MKAESINPEKNLQAAVPPTLLTQIERVAAAEHITVDQFVQEAVEKLLNRKEWQELLLFGEHHAQARHLTEDDIQEAIAAVQSQNVEHGY